MPKGGIVLGFQHLDLYTASRVLCKALELGEGLQRRLKDLLAAVGFSQERNGDGVCPAQKDPQNGALLGVKVSKSVKENIFTIAVV